MLLYEMLAGMVSLSIVFGILLNICRMIILQKTNFAASFDVCSNWWSVILMV